ncbi:MAG: hypothetical protein JO146_01205 [Candidatus Eremiobacteraeota bacterium]|nr:hypothetical protein [Candidatus Eremiobacteraeota bacterium]
MEMAWPPMDFAAWAPTKRTLHLIAQMFGKVRLALAPHQPNFIFTALYMTPRGFTTSPIPVGLRLVELRLDVVERRIEVQASDGGGRHVPFADLPSIAAVYAALFEALRALGVDVEVRPVPQEVPDTTPLDRDERPPAFELEHARRWLTVMSATQGIFDRWRAHFFGRTGIQLWWGAFDLALLLFAGKHVPAPLDRGYLMKYDLDAEMMNAGFYPGDDANPPFYYGYIYPEPPECGQRRVADGVIWSEAFREWIIPYDAVRNAPQPEELLRAFLDGVYTICGDAANWDRPAHSYVPPPLRHAR